MLGQKRAVSRKAAPIIRDFVVEGYLVRVELRFHKDTRLIISPQWPNLIPVSAPAALAEASSLLSEMVDFHRVEPIPINPRNLLLFDSKVLVFHLSSDSAQAICELKTLALIFRLIDEGGLLSK